MIKKILFWGLLIALLSPVIRSQPARFIFGPRMEEKAGTIMAEDRDSIEVEVWVRTEPGASIDVIQFSLSTNNTYIRGDSRAVGELLPPIDQWPAAIFLDPNDDPVLDGYTNQTFIASREGLEFEDPGEALDTDGEWRLMACYFMVVEDDLPDGTYYNVFAAGVSPCAGSFLLFDYPGEELTPDQYDLKFASLTISSELGIGDQIDLPVEFSLSQNYPNPFNAKTTIHFDLPVESDVTLEIFDILGARVEILVNERQPAGRHYVIWDAGNVPSGVYFYKIQTTDYTETKRLVLIK